MTEHNVFTDTNPYDNIRNLNNDNDEEEEEIREISSREEYTPPPTDNNNNNSNNNTNDNNSDNNNNDNNNNNNDEKQQQDQDEKVNDIRKQKEESTTPSTTQKEEENTTFWYRLSSIPLVQESVGKVQQYPLGRFALKQAETTWTKASIQANRSLPTYAQTYFNKVGCLSLDVLEQRFPVVYQPTEHIIHTVKQSSNQVYDTLLLPVHQAVHLMDRFWTTHNNKRRTNKQVNVEEELTHLYETKEMLQELFNQMTKMSDHLRDWTTCVASQVGNQIKDSYEMKQAECNQRILELTSELVTQLDSAYVKTVSIPPIIQTKLEPWIAFYHTIRNEATTAIDTKEKEKNQDISSFQKASRIIILTQHCLLPALQNSIDTIQEQLKHYATLSKSKVMSEFSSLNNNSIHA
ncbi:hypothetical protein INT45_012241 [Circinella minor]|uniref:Uncharacterized protein n=1 Tax=Circinella minor TaxID=1195481 RepID=A0A8H7VBS0_9FUNG|nr:hypothetical protein INT45_012241 [Circinella minor]